jgi:hypothetical protein
MTKQPPNPFHSAKAKLTAEKIEWPSLPDREAAIKDMELQWQDHFHMRDQSWRTVTNSALVFVGVVGLEVYRVPNAIMITAYCGLILLAFYGRRVTAHHRRIQMEEKFPIMRRYYLYLGLSRILDDVWLLPRGGMNAAGFIITCHWIIIAIAVLLLGWKFTGATFGAFMASPSWESLKSFLASSEGAGSLPLAGQA